MSPRKMDNLWQCTNQTQKDIFLGGKIWLFLYEIYEAWFVFYKNIMYGSWTWIGIQFQHVQAYSMKFIEGHYYHELTRITSIHETHAEFNKRLESDNMSKVAGGFLLLNLIFPKNGKKICLQFFCVQSKVMNTSYYNNSIRAIKSCSI